MKTITTMIYPAFALVALACLAVVPTTRAVTPAPDGFYPGFNGNGTSPNSNVINVKTARR